MGEEIDTIGTFTGPEIERALNWTRRDFELLKREGLVHGQLTEAARGRLARFHFNTLARMAMTRALAQHAEGYLVPARIVAAISSELERIYGHPPAGAQDRSLQLLARGEDAEMRGPDGELCPFRVLRLAYYKGDVHEDLTLACDYVLVIVDGEFVGSTNLLFIPGHVQFPKELATINSELRFTYTGKGAGAKIERLDYKEGEAFFLKRLEAAETVLSINLSLAIRRAVIAVVEIREGAR